MNALGTFYGSANNCQLYVKNCMHSNSQPIAMFENIQVVDRTFNHVQCNYEDNTHTNGLDTIDSDSFGSTLQS